MTVALFPSSQAAVSSCQREMPRKQKAGEIEDTQGNLQLALDAMWKLHEPQDSKN